jgi:hypothetical protein
MFCRRLIFLCLPAPESGLSTARRRSRELHQKNVYKLIKILYPLVFWRKLHDSVHDLPQFSGAALRLLNEDAERLEGAYLRIREFHPRILR